MPDATSPVFKVGLNGLTGNTGATGARMPEPVSNTNGRRNAAWNPVLPLTGGAVSGGIKFTEVIASSATDTTKQLDFGWGPNNYGFCITGGTLNCVAYQRHAFYYQYGTVTYAGEIRYKELWFSTDGWKLAWDGSTGNVNYYDPSGNGKWAYWGDYSRLINWAKGAASDTANNIIHMNGGGCYYYNVGGDKFNFNWDGTVYGRVNNAVQFAFQRACDERIKQDIAPSTFDCLAAIRKIRVYQYRWKNYKDPRRPKPAAENSPTIPIGFIAQRLYEDYPEAVARAPKLNVKGAQAMWSGDANTLMATLVGAIQQLDKEVQSMAEVA